MANAIVLPRVQWPTTPMDRARWVFGVVLAGLVGWMYFGQAVEVQHHGPDWSCYRWLINHWDYNYSHGALVPLIAGGILWMKWSELRCVTWRPVTAGAWVVGLAALAYYLGVKAGQPRAVVGSFVILLHGLALTLGGDGLYRRLFFPTFFLLLMIPLDFLDNAVGFPLQLLMARISTIVLNGLGIEAARLGTSIRSAVFDFDVANPCSGIRSLMALTTVTAAFAYVTQARQWKRWVLFLSAIPLAVLGNMGRVIGVALMGQVYGPKVALIAHDYSGFIVFGVALTAMVALALLLSFPYQRVLENWLRPVAATEPGGLTFGPGSKETHD